MMQTLLVVWRESLEAALIVGILLAYVKRSGVARGPRYVWGGTVAAAVAAVALGIASGSAVASLDPDTQELVHAGVLFSATAVLTWMVLWMHRQSGGLKGDLHRKADIAMATGRLLGLAMIAFVAVFREGIETVLFLWGIVAQHATANGLLMIVSGLAGLSLAVAMSGLFFRAFALLDLRTFFRVTGVLLLFVAGGLLMAGVNKLIMLDRLPPLVPQVWNTSWLVSDDSILGSVLGALIGYRSRPSLLEVLALVVYLPPMLWLLRRADVDRVASASDPGALGRAA